ncbi:MAG: TonB-dependent receptor plug domain-containing protein [Chthoniobacterales bacterium]|nr:TonB-dependent receptor plug domain-containing protein [Chthoniobacterales bacterium]
MARPSPTPPVGSSAVAEAETGRVTVVGRIDDLTGIATTASQGTVGTLDLKQRPMLRRGELLEVVPGLIITQHSGEGKANQYYLRGFNLDHGTDFAVLADGLPVNMRTHAHGQGYADINFIIPELVERIDFFKGPYFPAIGDFSGAGAAEFKLFKQLPQNIFTLEFGENDYFRALLAQMLVLRSSGGAGSGLNKDDAKNPAPLAQTKLLDAVTYALEFTNHNGPFDLEEDYQRYNGFLRYYAVRDADEFTLTAQAFSSRFDSPDQIPATRDRAGIDLAFWLAGHNGRREDAALQPRPGVEAIDQRRR